MLSRLFGKKKQSHSSVSLILDRLEFLMRYLERYSFKDKASVVSGLNNGLMLNIPTDMPDPEERIWPDPSNREIGISFACTNIDQPEQVTQFIIVGFGNIANTLLIGNAHDPSTGKLMWSVTPESEEREIPPLSEKVQSEIWQMSGWIVTGFGQYRFLERDST